MKQVVLLFAATAAALVTPSVVKKEQTPLVTSQDKTAAQNAVQGWWDALPNADSLMSPVEDRIMKSIQHSSLDDFFALFDSDEQDEDHPHPRPPHGGHGRHGHHGDPDKTIYELIKENKHTTKFAKIVDKYDEIKQLLQDTKHNRTLFVPTDRAFEHVPHDGHGHCRGEDDNDDDDDGEHKKPCKEFILALLKYHITPGLYPLHRIHASRTLPTELHTPSLDTSDSSSGGSRSTTGGGDHPHRPNHPQRIRTATTPLIHLTRLNFHARLWAGDFAAKNGLIHALDAILLPPPKQTTIIRLLPAPFSTLALALETTGLDKELGKDGLPRAGGGTLFAPTNQAWAMLGRRVNAFLFSERGKRYLRALVRYHVVLNETVYSDAYYRGGDGGDGEGEVEGKGVGGGYWHVDLPSLLHGIPISVDIKTWKGFVSIMVNGFVRVVVRDGVADDGVVQVVGRVLIPPHRHHGGHGEETEDMSVEELKDRLEPYLEEPELSGGWENISDL